MPANPFGPRRSAPAVLVLCFVIVLAAATAAHGQYFGANRVQYDRFEFQVLATEHFDIYYHQGEEESVRLAARLAERWYSRLSRFFGHTLSSRQPLVLYASHPQFRQTNVGGAEPGEGTGGFTEGLRRRIVLPFAGALAETDHVLGHELVHAFQFDITAAATPGTGLSQAMRLPLWFIEGMAEYLSVGSESTLTAMWMRDATARDRLPTIKDLDNPRYFPYRYGHALWAYIAGTYGEAAVADLLRRAPSARSFDELFTQVLGVDEQALSEGWRAATRAANARWMESTQRPGTVASGLIVEPEGERGLNLGPALSPDGSRVVFLSERDLFSIDMFLADARTGEVVRRIVRTDTDPHFDSLQFLDSAGTWHPDGRQFAFGALSAGKATVVVVDVDTAEVVSERHVDGVNAVFNPSWSPDGTRIAFSGMRGGVLDLFLLDAGTGAVTALTDDAWSQLEPEWSPDGRQLVLATDEFTSDLEDLRLGASRLATIDVQTREIRPLPTFDRGRSNSPHWLQGDRVAFVADPDGVPNVYVREPDGEARRLTNLQSGVSGITAMTPALSIAARSARVVFTAYEGDAYNLYAAESIDDLAAKVVAPTEGVLASQLPPVRDRRDRQTTQWLQAPGPAAPSAPTVTMQSEPYRARLGVDFVAQPTAGVGVDRLGAFAVGGFMVGFSDVLGNHQLVTAINANGRFQDVGGAVLYLNRERRWNWGVFADRAPYLTGGYGQGFVNEGGQVRFVEQQLLAREISHDAGGVIQYPFSRAMRMEGSAGVRHISYDYELTSRSFDAVTGDLLNETTEDLPHPAPLTLGQFSAALVRDTSIMGATGPLRGERFRIEASQTSGTLQFTGVLADYRRYVTPFRPVTVAGRLLHYGRYGDSSEDPRLSQIFLGSEGLVRGYDVGSFGASDCGAVQLAACNPFRPLLGSRIAVANLEVRAPVFGLFSRGRDYYGVFPVDFVAFADAGVAWTRDETPRFADGSRDWVRSVGVALRANVLGFVVAEVSYVRPLDRLDRGWRWEFNFVPGF